MKTHTITTYSFDELSKEANIIINLVKKLSKKIYNRNVEVINKKYWYEVKSI